MTSTGRVVIIEGSIGIGKSTFCNSLLRWSSDVFKGRQVVMILEDINNKILSEFLKDQNKMAFGFQMYAACARIATLREAESLARQGYIVLVDRGILGDSTFAKMHKQNGNISDSQWDCYVSIIRQAFPKFAVVGGESSEESQCEGHERHQRLVYSDSSTEASTSVPIDVIYLRAPAEISFERMKSRSIATEVDGYTLGYFEHLSQLHDAVLSEYPDTIELDFSADFQIDPATNCFGKKETVETWERIDAIRQKP
jgi:deoxyadenosine/deoxycytidine kinase